MNYLKVFFYVWKNSFSSAEYYKDVLKAPFSFSLKYFVFFCFLLAVFATVFLSIKVFIPLNEFVNRFPNVLGKVYPAELEIKIDNGTVSTNVPEPYFIPIDRFEETFEELDKEVQGLRSDDMENILVIDTNATVEDMERYQTFILLTRNHLSFYKEDGRIEIVELDKVNNFTLNKNLVEGVLNRLLPFFKLMSIFLIPFIFVGAFLFFTTSQLIYLLFTAFILCLGAKLISYPIRCMKIYQIDLHLATIITPFFLVLNVLNIQVQFPFLRLILFTAIGLFILYSLKKTSPKKARAKR